ncbi:MAG: hypothetical protein L6435_11355 [Anaerolineae bacterium]|nr:hypothetical protein [Anaerolineae bacterium]
MTKLVMALRCIDGIVLGADMPAADAPENEGAIRPLSRWVAILVHDERPFGNRLIDEFLAASPKLDVPVKAIAQQAHASFDTTCRQLADQQQPVPFPLGMIMAGIDGSGTGDIEFWGLHAGHGFEPRLFGGNLFGGECNTIARFMDSKIHTFSIGVDRALRRGTFYFVETRSVPALKLEPSLRLATITYSDGFGRVDQERVTEYLGEASGWSERLFTACASVFSPVCDGEIEGHR